MKRTVTIKRYTEVSLTEWHGSQHDISDDSLNPEVVYLQKIEALAEILDCGEEEAERFLKQYSENI